MVGRGYQYGCIGRLKVVIGELVWKVTGMYLGPVLPFGGCTWRPGHIFAKTSNSFFESRKHKTFKGPCT